jgi:hypothetical protein
VKGRSLVALVLAVGVTVVLVLLGAAVYVTAEDPSQVINDAASNLVSGVIGTVVGALAVYLGGSEAEDRSQRHRAGDVVDVEADEVPDRDVDEVLDV